MTRALLVKMSSLGDVVHTLPAIEDAAREGIKFDWVVEEGFASIASLHPAVENVVPIALRQWRRTPVKGLGELRRFRARLRAHRYDLVIDAQGLIKSAVVGRWARADTYAGYIQGSAREKVAARLYSRRVEVPKSWHAVERLRRLFAISLGYKQKLEKASFGIAAPDQPVGQELGQERGELPCAMGSHAVLLPGTTWTSKLWPETHWFTLGHELVAMGLTPLVAWGTEQERDRAERIVAKVAGSELAPALELPAWVDVLRSARVVVGVDTGLAHLAAALGRPTVMVFGPTDASLTGCIGERATNLQAAFICSPCLSKTCSYSASVPGNESRVWPPCFASVGPSEVVAALHGCME